MAAQTPCSLCERRFDVPVDAVENNSSSFFLTANDQLELASIRERSFHRNLRVFVFVKLAIKNYTVNNANELQQIIATTGNAASIVRREDDRQPSFFSRALSRYNWTTTDRTNDPKFAAPYMGEKTIIRTMPDGHANINHLVWVIKRAHKNTTGLNAFFLHKKHVVWVAITDPPRRSQHEQQVADRDVEVLTTELKKLFLFRSNFKKINHLMIGTGAITYFEYPSSSRRLQPVVLRASGPSCPQCEKAYPIPESATLNKVVDHTNEYYLTAGDLAALTNIKHESFNKRVVRLGFITRVTSNLNSKREIAARIGQGNVREVVEEVRGRARVFTEPIQAFKRAITYLTSGQTNDLMSNHNGESVLFRTMPDISVNAKHVAWLIEEAQEQRTEVNAFFLHKRHFVWVKAARPREQSSAADNARSRTLVRYVVKDLRKNFALRKSTIPAINKKLVGIARVAYHTYPDRTWVDSVTDALSDNKVMSLSVAGAILLGVGYAAYSSVQTGPTAETHTSGAKSQNDTPPGESTPPRQPDDEDFARPPLEFTWRPAENEQCNFNAALGLCMPPVTAPSVAPFELTPPPMGLPAPM